MSRILDRVRREADAQRSALKRRDGAILKALDEGYSLRQIAAAAGLSHVAIVKPRNRS